MALLELQAPAAPASSSCLDDGVQGSYGLPGSKCHGEGRFQQDAMLMNTQSELALQEKHQAL